MRLDKNRRFPNRWMRFVTREEMSASERLVWRVINEFHHTNVDGWPSEKTIAEVAGMTRYGVQKVILSLEAKNLVTVTRVGPNNGGETNRYVATVPEGWLQRMEGVPARLAGGASPVGGASQRGRRGPANPVGMKGSGGRESQKSVREAPTTTPAPTDLDVPSPQKPQYDEDGYPTVEFVIERLGLKDHPSERARESWSDVLHPFLDDPKDPQLVRDVVHWFPGNPSKKKGGKPYWSFIDSLALVVKHWDKLEGQCIEDLNGGRRLRAVR
jgi:hypothetical protein